MGSILSFGRFLDRDAKTPPRNWTNQELAELYRVHDVLNQAGMAVQMDSGLSDEGDPWFIFFHEESQEVIAHFARIDGQIIAAAVGVEKVLKGRDFSVIIKEILAQHPVALPQQQSRGKIVKLHLHPAIILSAFVCAAFLHSKKSLAATTSHDKESPAGESRAGHGVLMDASSGASAGVFSSFAFSSSFALVAAVAQLDDDIFAAGDSALVSAAVAAPAPEVDGASGWTAPPPPPSLAIAEVSEALTQDSTAMASAPAAAVAGKEHHTVRQAVVPDLIVPSSSEPAAVTTITSLPDHVIAQHEQHQPQPIQVDVVPDAHQSIAVSDEAPVATGTAILSADTVSIDVTALLPMMFEDIGENDDFVRIDFDVLAAAELSMADQAVASGSSEDEAVTTVASAPVERPPVEPVDRPSPASNALEPVVPVTVDVVLSTAATVVTLTDDTENVYFSGGNVQIVNFTAGVDSLLIATDIADKAYSLEIQGDDISLLFKDGSSLTLVDFWF